jgi:cytochrome P450 PksS
LLRRRLAYASPRGAADLIDRYARKLPLSVICELLGLPLADRAKFTAWAGGARASGASSDS